MKTKFLKTLLETLDIIIMEYGEHMEEASRGLEETRFAYVDNCVKGFERVNNFCTHVYVWNCAEQK